MSESGTLGSNQVFAIFFLPEQDSALWWAALNPWLEPTRSLARGSRDPRPMDCLKAIMTGHERARQAAPCQSTLTCHVWRAV